MEKKLTKHEKAAQSAFFDLMSENQEHAIQLITMLFVGLLVEAVNQNGGNGACEITITCDDFNRVITIHPLQ